MSQVQSPTSALQINSPLSLGAAELFSGDALRFLEKLVPRVPRAAAGIASPRAERQREFDAGQRSPIFLPRRSDIRAADWTVAPIPDDLQDRRVEITGPTDRKMIINALNSGASVYMADFEDANSPTWQNLVDGQRNLCDAINGTIRFTSPEGKPYQLNKTTATLMVRPRGGTCRKSTCGWTASRCRPRCSTSASSFSTTPESCSIRAAGPYFYLPKLESHLEARLWNDVFLMAQDELGIPRGSIRATVLIETIPAAFEMDEILYELREHSAGLNCGRWDYIFSIIKKFCKDPAVHHAGQGAGHHDRALHALVFAAGDQDLPSPGHSCHRRHGRPDPHQERSRRRTPRPLEKVRADKEREAGDGHDGTWVAHPGLVPTRQSVLRRPHAAAQPNRPPPRRRPGDGRRLADASPRARSASAGCARTSTWAFNTWPPGWGATAACRSTTSWRTPPRRKSPAPRSGNGFTNPTASLRTAGRSRRNWSAGYSRNRWKLRKNLWRRTFRPRQLRAGQKADRGDRSEGQSLRNS